MTTSGLAFTPGIVSDDVTDYLLLPELNAQATGGSLETTSDDSRLSLSPNPSSSSSSASSTSYITPDEGEHTRANWPTGGFDPSWMNDTSSDEDEERDDERSSPSLLDYNDRDLDRTTIGPRQLFTPVIRSPLEPLLPQRYNSPSVFLDSDRSGYNLKSISFGTLDDRTYKGFAIEREVGIENGRLALQAGGVGGGGIDISGYGSEHSSAFHLKFPPGSVQALYFLRHPRNDSKGGEVEKVSLVVSTLQTPVFRASISSRADYEESSTARVSALDSEHYRLVPYLSRYFLIELSFATDEIFNPYEPLPATFDNFLFDLDQLENFPSPTYLDSTNFIVKRNSTSEYSPEILEELSSSFGGFDSPSLAFPLEWIVYDGTLTPTEVISLIEDHVRAWEVTADYDEELVEEILYELRTTLVEKRQARFEYFQRGESFVEDNKVRFEGIEKEAELAREKVIARRKGLERDGEPVEGLLAAGEAKISRKRPHKKGRRHAKVTLEERGRRNLYWAKSVIVTPSGSIKIQGRSVEKTNSIVRSNFDGVDHFLRVSFKEEDGLTLGTVGGLEARSQHELFDGSITCILKNGLVLGGRRFELLSYSQASLREAAAIFLAPFPSSVVRNGIRQTRLIDAKQIRSSMGRFDKVSFQPAMLGARWSQSFTTTSASVVMRDHQIYRIDDISEYDARGKEITCHTDGAGLLTPKLRDMLCEALIANGYRLSSTAPFPSVFQFRLGGHKGVVAVDNTQHGIGLAVRPSQEKFLGVAENDEGDSFVLNIAEAFDRPRPLRLNRPLISALEDLGIDASVLLKYQRNAVSAFDLPKDERVFRAAYIQLLGSSLGGPSGFQSLLRSFSQLDSLPPSLLTDEPFLRQALDVVRIRVLRSYKYHASIPLPDCYLLVGVPDEDGVLEEDQVYIALRDPQNPETVKYIEGRIAITRSPTVDAGDVRIVNAIGKYKGHSRLTSLENCVVLPTKGKRSLCSMMGGGDLDGDTYQIITLPDLIPDKMFPPAIHTATPPLTLDRPATIDDVADCFVHYLENNLVGAIATKHLMVSDKSPKHGRDPIAIKLAELHSHSVDSPKTGQVVRNEDLPRIPDYLKRERPDFLQPENKSDFIGSGYYPSERALGQLYRDIDYEEIKIPQEILLDESHSHSYRDGSSSSFKVLRSIIDEKVSKFLNVSLESLDSEDTLSKFETYSLIQLRTSFCSHLRDLVTVHSFPRSTGGGGGGGRKLSEVEIFAVTNLAISTRDTIARGNAVIAMGTQLDSLVEWLKRRLSEGGDGRTRNDDGIRKMRNSWLLSLREEGKEEWEYGTRIFGWITLSILLENLLRVEFEEKKKEIEEQAQIKTCINSESSSTTIVDKRSTQTLSTPPPQSVDTSPFRQPKSFLESTRVPSHLGTNPILPSSNLNNVSTNLLSQQSIRSIPPPPPPPRSTTTIQPIPLPQPLNKTITLSLSRSRSSVTTNNSLSKDSKIILGGGQITNPNPDPDPWQTDKLIKSTYSTYHNNSYLYPSSSSIPLSRSTIVEKTSQVNSSSTHQLDLKKKKKKKKMKSREERSRKKRARKGKINASSSSSSDDDSESELADDDDDDDDKEEEDFSSSAGFDFAATTTTTNTNQSLKSCWSGGWEEKEKPRSNKNVQNIGGKKLNARVKREGKWRVGW